MTTISFEPVMRFAIGSPKPLSPQLYEAANAKLLRIGDFIWTHLYWLVEHDKSYGDVVLRATSQDIEHCRKDLKYEYLGLKDSWL